MKKRWNTSASNSMRMKMMNNQLSFILCAGSTVFFMVAWLFVLRVIKVSAHAAKVLYLLLMTISGIGYLISILISTGVL